MLSADPGYNIDFLEYPGLDNTRVRWRKAILNQIARRHDELVAAAQYSCHARRLFGSMQTGYDIARVYLLWTELGNRQNRPDIYTPSLFEAHALFRQRQVPKYVAQAQALANCLGLPLP